MSDEMDDTMDGADDSIDASMDASMEDADGAGEDLGALDVDPDDLDDDSVALEVDLEGDDLDAEPAGADDVEIPVAPDRLGIDDEEEEERPRRRVSEEDVDDNEMLSKEDVEADLASILQEKQTMMVWAKRLGVLGAVVGTLLAAPVMAPDLRGWLVFATPLDAAQMDELEKLAAIPLTAMVLHGAAESWSDAQGPVAAPVARQIAVALANGDGNGGAL